MKDILEMAAELGKLIAASDRMKALNTARTNADGDAGLRTDMEELASLSQKLAALEKGAKPIEPEQKRQLRDLQEKVTRHPKMRELARAEADFAEMLNRVNAALRASWTAQSAQAR